MKCKLFKQEATSVLCRDCQNGNKTEDGRCTEMEIEK